MAQLAEADMRQERADLCDPGRAAEVELARRRDRIRDPEDDDPLEPQGDPVLRLLGELEGGLLLRAGHQHEDGARAQDRVDGRAAVLEGSLVADQEELVGTGIHNGHSCISERDSGTGPRGRRGIDRGRVRETALGVAREWRRPRWKSHAAARCPAAARIGAPGSRGSMSVAQGKATTGSPGSQ